MDRPKGSKNKKKNECFTKLSHFLTEEIAFQDATHARKENQKVLALINGNESETEQEYESDLDDSVFDKTYDPTEKQMDQDKQPTESSTQLEHGQKSTQNEKATTSKN